MTISTCGNNLICYTVDKLKFYDFDIHNSIPDQKNLKDTLKCKSEGLLELKTYLNDSEYQIQSIHTKNNLSICQSNLKLLNINLKDIKDNNPVSVNNELCTPKKEYKKK